VNQGGGGNQMSGGYQPARDCAFSCSSLLLWEWGG
jgi:hypothetical protein